MILIRSGRHPHEVFLLGWCAAAGASGLLTKQVSSGTISSLPAPWALVFYAAMVLGATISLIGIALRGLAGPLVERSGLLVLTGLFASYAVAVVAIAGIKGLFLAGLFAGLTAANMYRAYQITRDLKQVFAAASYTDASEQLGGEP